ncbi:hypothetical protein ACF1B0_30260 [Streptomyces anandii]|uniref:hypothetical protein n=1 Tax=Streptomyces anandii TaxID=285454 RepID=UPI0036F60208
MPPVPPLNDRYHRDLARVTVLRCFGIRAEDPAGKNSWSLWRGLLFLAVILIPPAVACLNVTTGRPIPQGGRAYLFWIVYYVLLDLFVVLAQWAGCRAFHRALPSVDRMLTSPGAQEVHDWIDRGLRPWRQERWMLAGAGASCLSLWALSRVQQVVQHMHIDAASYMTVTLAGSAGTNSMYWLLRASRLSRLITKPGHLRLTWSAPARTPGIEALSRWYRIVTLWCVFGAALAFAPWVWLAPFVARNGAYLATKWVVAVILLLSIVLFGFYSQWRLSQAVLEKRMAVLHVLARRLPRHPPGAHPLTEEEAQVVELFDKVSASPAGVIDGQTVASTLVSVAAVLVPLAVAALLR